MFASAFVGKMGGEKARDKYKVYEVALSLVYNGKLNFCRSSIHKAP